MRRILLHQFEFGDFGSRQQTFQHHHVVVQFSQRRFELFVGVNAILVTVQKQVKIVSRVVLFYLCKLKYWKFNNSTRLCQWISQVIS